MRTNLRPKIYTSEILFGAAATEGPEFLEIKTFDFTKQALSVPTHSVDMSCSWVATPID